MANILTLQGYIEQTLTLFKDKIPAFKKIDYFGGTFSPEQLKLIASKTPALLLTLRGINQFLDAPHGRAIDVQMTACILVGNAGREDKSIDRNIAILPFVEAVTQVLDNNDNYSIIEAPYNVTAENLYNPTGVQIASFAVHWEQRINIGTEEESIENLDDFLRIGLGVTAE